MLELLNYGKHIKISIQQKWKKIAKTLRLFRNATEICIAPGQTESTFIFNLVRQETIMPFCAYMNTL